MTDRPTRYKRQTVKAVRGTEDRVIAKWTQRGWELEERTPGKLRTELVFRHEVSRALNLPLVGLIAAAVILLAVGAIAERFSDQDEPAETSAQGRSATSDASSSEPMPTSDPSATPSESAPSNALEPDPDPITARSSAAFAALLRVPDGCSPEARAFARENEDRIVEFNGSVIDLANNGDYNTRFDVLLGPGDRGPNTVTGPIFKFEDVNFFDLNVSGGDSVSAGDLVRTEAIVDRYAAGQCLLFLKPVSTTIRR